MAYIPAGELRTVRERLGLTTAQLSRLLDVRHDTVRKWEIGRYPIPARVPEEIDKIQQVTDDAVKQLVARLTLSRDSIVVVYRDTESVPADRRDIDRFGAGWWRAVVAQAVREVPAVVVCYPDEVELVAANSTD